MKVLYISPSIPNDFSRIRTKNILKALKNKNHKITLISLYSSDDELKYLKETKEIVDNVILIKQKKIFSLAKCLIGIVLPVPLRIPYVHNFTLRKKLKTINSEYDFVYIKRLRMAQYAKYFDHDKVYIDITDSLTKYYDRIRKKTSFFKKILSEEEYFKHKIYEKKIVLKYKTVICSEEDKKYLQKLSNDKLINMAVIDNTIDSKEWIIKDIKPHKPQQRTKLVFSGLMDYEPNILAIKYFMNEIFPFLPKKYKITFVGKNCPDELKKYESERVTFTGYVENMKEELRKHDIYVCPITAGSGVKNKILQSSCVGLPIISSDLGIEGLSKKVKKQIFTANNSKEYIDAIIKIDNMPTEELENIIKKQQDLIKEYYDLNVGVGNLVEKVRK